ncbi:unnamed protein product [Amoebophrya sp. A25]|nr:unnamed protein product [Amoebophrya sp. A25]|eukprot:GSA25T00007039001.1
MEVNLDTIGGKAYASRNHNDIRHIWQAQNTERNQIDFLLTLRQTPAKLPKTRAGPSDFSAHSPRQKPFTTTEPEQGKYLTRWRSRSEEVRSSEETFANGRYGNFADTKPMLDNATNMRVSGGGFSEVNWQLNLRGGSSGKPDLKWKRYFSKPHQSFDMAPTNFENYGGWISPSHKKHERNNNALPISTIRDMPLDLKRWPGCEGTATNNWEHLTTDRKHGHKSRNNMKWETTLRAWDDSGKKEDLGSKLQDSRSEGCLTEMLGKKNWHYGRGKDVGNDLALPYAAGGDVKLHHIRPVLGEPHDDSLRLRRSKHPRLPAPQ